MGTRTELHEELLTMAEHAYYNPPSSVKMKYPCFVYKRDRIKSIRADNQNYKNFNHYTLTYISLSVAEDKVDEILSHFTCCRYDRPYEAEGLHHYVFDLYY